MVTSIPAAAAHQEEVAVHQEEVPGQDQPQEEGPN